MLSDWASYVSERVLIPKIIVLCVLLSVGVWFVADGAFSNFICAFAIAGLYVITFRLVDDLTDRAHDSAVHPERCLVRTQYIGSFWALSVCLIIVLVSVIAFWLTPSRGFGMLVLAGAMFLLGMAYRSYANRRAIIAAAVLLKYPAVILLMASEPEQVSSIILAAGFYAVSFADEVLA